MSENYGTCPLCRGRGTLALDQLCGRCEGTGKNGDATLFYQRELDKEWERDFYNNKDHQEK